MIIPPSLLLLLACFNLVQHSQGDKFDDAINQALTKNHIRGAAIAYFDRSRMAAPIARGYGRIASSDSSDLVDGDTAFMLASVSKVFTASMVTSLIDQGIISLDDDICNVKPRGWGKGACRNRHFPSDKITWRMLVTHRSSIISDIPDVLDNNGDLVSPSYGPTGGYDDSAVGNPKCPLEDVLGFYRDFLTNKRTETSIGRGVIMENGQPLNWYQVARMDGGAWKKYRPGSKNVYSNAGFGYLAALVQLKTGKSFPSLCKKHLFEPLGMNHTAWFLRDLPAGTTVAVPVEYHSGKKTWKDVGQYCFIDYACGELRTSARDMVKWASAMLDYGAPTLWSNNTGREAFRCQEQDASGKRVRDCEVGIGWGLLDNSLKGTWAADNKMTAFEKYNWTDGVWHDGSESGVQTHLVVLPSAGVFVAALTNTDMNGDWAAQLLAEAVVNAPIPS